MDNPRIIKAQITINAPASKVWDALVNPSQTKKYMFGCEVVSDFKAGSPILWKGLMEDKEVIFVKGNMVNIEPEKQLIYTTFDPNADWEDIPENYLTVTYNLTHENGLTTLSVTHGDFATVAEGEKRYNDTMSGGGWDSILQAIRNLVE
ncbi:SRPBCC domain-containing protein [Fulvivirgaceae bacterium BMA12]|uniref:SRPBCC domain-containing protein n=1 Tax=Agaribacillus aureus TaxID=3051825 RepID=A0ABT8LAR9_9BACT|nr:SRPBCC domain-containing protein [Fulvivirgaceae bacterium BMA12]